ncbi:hypothetical protein HMI54_001092 [Coelomomyces lativittatus]|nr:hypothetical protein HMI56_002427 [Coelomomyces lativittatus]KAJ1511044.1 hypothetical protein HMI54_001092 [Coelomomyces lativittatus]KAJ1517157.1 hypothetical protein HMI55_000502 [Coelomomyces lativittatus]
MKMKMKMSYLLKHPFIFNRSYSFFHRGGWLSQGRSLRKPSFYVLPSLASLFHTSALKLDQVQLTIDGKTVSIERGAALIQACEQAGIAIPRFCYHERLAIAGNCRMCLVELANVPKPIASCAMPVGPGMVVKTNTPMVKKAREGVMEFLLANHPLDCPICDQGGECDLQDQAMVYGNDRSRFFFPKRAVEDKDFGPLVATNMTRCIQCTRCVRFANEIAGEDGLGTTGRGNDMQIGLYIDRVLQTEVSGNVIDLCPVGALTNKPYAFKARPWELRKTESIDILDPVHPSIRIDARGNEVLRVLPRENPSINEEWISDKTRFAVDGLKYQRLTTPYLKHQGKLTPVSWESALSVISDQVNRVSPSEMVAVAGDLADIPSMVVLKDFFSALDADQFSLTSALSPPNVKNLDFRSQYLLNTPLMDMEHADAILLIATHPRLEAPLLNLRLRKAYLKGTDIAYLGEDASLPQPVGFSYDVIPISSSLASGWHSLTEHPFWSTLKKAQRPLILMGASVYDHPHASTLLNSLSKLYSLLPNLFQKVVQEGTTGPQTQVKWHGVNFLQQGTSHVAAMDIGFYGGRTQGKFMYLLNAEIKNVPKDSFVVYQGHHGDVGASMADVILPGCAFTEKTSVYMNVEGKAQSTEAAVSPPGLAREDWKILQAVAIACGIELPYFEYPQLLQRLHEISPTLVSSHYQPCTFPPSMWPSMPPSTHPSPLPWSLRIKSRSQFYLSDPISKASPTMAECARVYGKTS